jgi:hypothetical protein
MKTGDGHVFVFTEGRNEERKEGMKEEKKKRRNQGRKEVQ